MNKLRLIPIVLILFNGCTILDFTELIVTASIEDYDIVSEDESIILSFNKPIKEEANEPYIYIEKGEERISCNFEWDESQVYLTPGEDLSQGELHFLIVNGNIETSNNQNYIYLKIIPFYYLSASPPNRLIEINPSDEVIVGINTPLIFTFGETIDDDQWSDYFTLTPNSEFDHKLNKTQVTISPSEGWSNLTRYGWEIKKELPTNSGKGLTRDFSGNFIVQEDIAPPVVLKLLPCEFQESLPIYPRGASLDDIKTCDSIYIQWSKPMNFQSLINEIDITPGTGGTLHPLGEKDFLFTPENELDFQESYILKLGESIEDETGNSILAESLHPFELATITPMEIESIVITHQDGDTSILEYNNDEIHLTHPMSAPRNLLSFTLYFSYPYLEESEQIQIEENLSISLIFPSTVQPSITYSHWLWDDVLMITYEDFDLDTAYPLIHELRLMGGKSSINSSTGGYFTEDIYVYFDTQ